MRAIAIPLLAGLLAACGDSGADDTARLVTPELADASGGAANGAGGDPAAAALLSATATSDDAASGPEQAAVANSSSPSGEQVAGLPLRLGFYVSSDVSCAQASNATLQLLHRDGINTSRTPCDFSRIEKIADNRYRVTESCTEIGGWGDGEQNASTNTAIYEILNETRFKVVGDSWESTMQYCAQSSLPEPWRDNDISDITG